MKTWYCKIGEVEESRLPNGVDMPMREAVERAYFELTGEEPRFTFSGWGAELDESERAVVEDREPDPYKLLAELRKRIDVVERQIKLIETPVPEGA